MRCEVSVFKVSFSVPFSLEGMIAISSSWFRLRGIVPLSIHFPSHIKCAGEIAMTHDVIGYPRVQKLYTFYALPDIGDLRRSLLNALFIALIKVLPMVAAVGIHPIAPHGYMDHPRLMYEKNPILNMLSIGLLIGLLLIAVWGTTFAAQAITGKSLTQHGRGCGTMSVSHQCRVVAVPSL
jgi:hypothetical protein